MEMKANGPNNIVIPHEKPPVVKKATMNPKKENTSATDPCTPSHTNHPIEPAAAKKEPIKKLPTKIITRTVEMANAHAVFHGTTAKICQGTQRHQQHSKLPKSMMVVGK